MDELLFEPFDIALGADTVERLRAQFENYEYYDGKQHFNTAGELVKAKDLEQPPDLDYTPTRYATNYFKTVINRKARWQMSGKHGIHVPREQVDTIEDTMVPGYVPSDAQIKANERAEGYEKLLYQLWHENKMRARLLSAARDRLIADRVVCKIVYNPNTGRLKWVWRPDTEFIPVFSDDDFEEMIACHFIRQKVVEDSSGDEVNAIQKQTFTLEGEGETRQCYLEETVILADDLSVFETITPHSPMGLDFIPVVMFPVNDLLAENNGDSEVADLREQNDILNQMNEDAIDSLKFEMFGMTAIINAPEGTGGLLRIAPGAVLEARGVQDGMAPSIKKIENGFKWKEAFKDQYMRVKAAMHEISSLPQVVPQEMNFGGLNSDTLQIMFHDIINDTEEHWLAWDYGLQELHEKSIKYLQARSGEGNMKYDKAVIRAIDTEVLKPEMRFVLPLPDNRADLVQLLAEEMANDLESKAGAMERLGVENVQAKKQEIKNEKQEMMQLEDPYAAAGGAGLGVDLTGQTALTTDGPIKVEKDAKGVLRDEKGEEMVVCPTCNGSGVVLNPDTGSNSTCMNCQGDGYTQLRKR